MSYVGIDYSGGLSNRDPENPDFHYGTISQHTPAGWIWDDFEGIYFHGCPNCGNEFDDEFKPVIREDDNEEYCPHCGHVPDNEDDWYGDESIGQEYTGGDGYKIDYSEDLCCFWVCGSPFYALASYCSPCAPGAGDLDSPNADGVKTYALGPDFFDSDNPCPYPIYSVETGELVQAGPDQEA